MVQVHLGPPKNILADNNRKYGGVAQLGEHLPCKQGVRSSILLVSTILLNLEKYIEETEIKVRNLLKSNFERVTRLGTRKCELSRKEVKLLRAYGGCLGARSRRRTR